MIKNRQGFRPFVTANNQLDQQARLISTAIAPSGYKYITCYVHHSQHNDLKVDRKTLKSNYRSVSCEYKRLWLNPQNVSKMMPH